MQEASIAIALFAFVCTPGENEKYLKNFVLEIRNADAEILRCSFYVVAFIYRK